MSRYEIMSYRYSTAKPTTKRGNMTERTIDCTPTWEAILPLLVEVAVNGETVEGRKVAMKELTRMARLADHLVAQEQAKSKGSEQDD